jgi:hypothetical protein
MIAVLAVRDRTGAFEWKDRFQRVMWAGVCLRATRNAGGLSVVLAIPIPGVRDIDSSGACRLPLALRLSAQGLRNGPDPHRMAETRHAARGAA